MHIVSLLNSLHCQLVSYCFLTVLFLNQTSYSRGVAIQFRNEEESEAFHCIFQQWKKEFNVQGADLAKFV